MIPEEDTAIPGDPVAPIADPLIGALLGKYRLLRRIGRGGMGAVYEAEDPSLGRVVALKVLLPELAERADAAKRFEIEARAAARLNHPNVVAVYDVGVERGTAWLVMERVRGESAQARIQERGPLPWREATATVADVCRGLAAAHEAGLIHRDIKPANLLLLEDGRAKLADFGLAKILDGSSPALTGSGYVLGTPHFMSPEQGNGTAANERSDLYSVGATYYALLTGQPPYPGTTPLQVLHAHFSGPIPDPRTVRPGVPEPCAAVIRRAMAKDPADRYASAGEMLAALEATLGDQAQPTARSSAPGRPRPSARAWLAAVVLLLVAACGIWTLGRTAAEVAADAAWSKFAPQVWELATHADWPGARARCDAAAADPDLARRAARVAALARVLDLGHKAEQAVSAALARDVGRPVRLETDSGEVLEGRIAAAPEHGRVRLLREGQAPCEVDLLQLTREECLRLARRGLADAPACDAALAILAFAAGASAEGDALLTQPGADRRPEQADLNASAEGWPAPWSPAEIAVRRASAPHRKR